MDVQVTSPVASIILQRAKNQKLSEESLWLNNMEVTEATHWKYTLSSEKDAEVLPHKPES